MRSRPIMTGIPAAIGILILILDGKTALSGAHEGLSLAVQVVIPSLFPFFFLSQLLTGSLSGVNSPILTPFGKLFGIPPGTEGLLIPGLLGGYPAGAGSIGNAYRSGILSRRNAERMLAFCNNAGPSFLFGMVAPMFADPAAAWLLWGIHIISAVLVSRIFSCDPEPHAFIPEGTGITPASALSGALRIMAAVCGWVILFRVLLAFLDRWIFWLMPAPVRFTATGILELSNGICTLIQLPDEKLRFLLCSILLAQGGVCVAMQTASAAAGLSLRWYYAGKLLQSVFSATICIAMLYNNWVPAAIICLILALRRRKTEKSSSQLNPIGV